MVSAMTNLQHTQALLEIMAQLRNPQGGCPWDLAQNFETIAPYTLEEAYEVADAIERGNMHDLKHELGDLLLQVVFHAQIAKEIGAFTFEEVAEAVAKKMRTRHPHVFGNTVIESADEQTMHWEKLKAAERAQTNVNASALDGVALGLPALLRAQKLQKRAARVGFDWPDISGVLNKLQEEIGELNDAIASGNTAHAQEELGDALFALVNVARFLDADAETALRSTNTKFTRRFTHVENAVRATGKTLENSTLEIMEQHWNEAKTLEKTA
jgi:nucleoside triphosphate diphosphatase